MAFRLFDTYGVGQIDFNDFRSLLDANESKVIPFDWSSEWAALYTGGRNKRHTLTYPQFSQMLRALQGEKVRQAFQHFDQNGDGYIEPEDFQQIILETSRHKLSDHILTNLHTLCNISAGAKISYANVRAFQNMIREMDLMELVVKKACARSTDGKITRTDFLNEAGRITRFSLFTPMEADIVFHFAGMDEPSGRLGLLDFAKVLDASWRSQDDVDDSPITQTSKSFLSEVVEGAHHFALGSIAGAFGAFMVYPIDLVKTRMQNQRGSGGAGHTLLYKNSLDCASKVLKNEGVRGFYSGVLPQMIGVAPEKAIKLTVNDFVRGKMTNKDTGKIWVGSEFLAGATAGGCQVVSVISEWIRLFYTNEYQIFTNPLEIVKIRLQVQGELAKNTSAPRHGAIWIIRNLGLKGLYKGATACLSRDIPFSAIYFPSYAHLKSDVFGESPTKKLGVLQLLTAGAIAGMPAAYMTTPFDVIKTRLQVEARKGEQTYTTLRHCARTIYQQEGFRAFFKGGPARILRSSPQFGFTLAGYEVLQGLFPLHGGEDATAAKTTSLGGGDLMNGNGGHVSAKDLPFLRSRNALKILLDLDPSLGIPKISSSKSWVVPGDKRRGGEFRVKNAGEQKRSGGGFFSSLSR
jgi:solute carrier family 25 (mitochondrial aspartate/glutamate transporter), member 12/13